ncbi:hypothetical protein AFV6_gp34 [Betalipothrixvirus pozzuoliense]|uniref:Uncharacterized protein n=1 Tax=Betalipothrixvirus pozzuoliense TaxID=346882 RepID=A7WKI8_9VIRU|nr:hypothetical protein AFV6_gp34 [Acidianus filamentous virus 6]CAJ31588.1 conserved hypothetical protein [Acidianus filamentous virus 6]
MDKIRLLGSVAYVYKVFVSSLENMGIKVVSGALNEKSVVVAIPFQEFSEQLTADINKELWSVKIKNGKLFLVGMKELVDADLKEVNNKILSKLKKMGIDSTAYITDDGDAVVMVSLSDVILRILEKTLQETKTRAGNHMRSLRVQFGNDEKYGYVVIYMKSQRSDDVRKQLQEVLDNE